LIGDASGDHFGAALAGLDSANGSEPGIIVGAPGVDRLVRPDAGRTFVIRSSALSGGYSATQASTSSSSSHPCVGRGTAPTTDRPEGTAPHPFTRPNDLAHCRRTNRGVADLMPHGRYASAR